MIFYTVGNIEQYDDPKAHYKAQGGSVWPTVEGAMKYVDRLTSQGQPVQGGVYEVIIPDEAPLDHWMMPSRGDWMTLIQPAPLGKCVHKGVEHPSPA